MAVFGFIGMGNMGYAILKGLLKEYKPDKLLFTDVDKQRGEKVQEETGVMFIAGNAECANKVKYLILAVKPQYYDAVLKNIQYIVRPDQIIISIAPGITVDALKAKLGADKRIVRAMPNTPALLGAGMTGVCYNDSDYTKEEKETLERFFCSFGKMERVEERLMDAVGSLSGCSPAYVYMMIEAMADGGVKYGLPRKTAYQMAAQTVLGSAMMVLETGMHPAELKDMVCSPGGTTIAGVSALEEQGFRNALIKAIDASYEKTLRLKQ